MAQASRTSRLPARLSESPIEWKTVQISFMSLKEYDGKLRKAVNFDLSVI